MSKLMLCGAAALYILASIDLTFKGNYIMALVIFCYAVANVGLAFV